SRDDNWGQKRELMPQGHFTGFDRNILEEDIVVQVSMGPITDRTLEHLSASDVAIVQMRRMLLDALRAKDSLPPGSARAAAVPKLRHPIDTVLAAAESWQTR